MAKATKQAKVTKKAAAPKAKGTKKTPVAKKPAAKAVPAPEPKGAQGAISRAALAGEADPLLVRFNASIDVDRKLYKHDIRGSRAHARMLGKQGIIPKADAKAIDEGLQAVEGQIDRGEMAWSLDLEDIHTHVERALQKRIGPAAGRLHTGRSRNDQVALDARLYLTQEAAPRLVASLRGLMTALVRQARAHEGALMPGYTHLQRAQPMLFAHHLLAYVEMFSRDVGRVVDARARADECPLGSGALAATPFPIDREAVAKELGFARVTHNSIDATSSRDAMLELMSACAIATTHASRIAEELVLWSTTEFQFVSLSDAYCTGSSIMPQKRNPDAAELSRGKAGRVIGDLVALFTTVKGLPLAYNKDLQEDKQPLFDAVDSACDVLDVMTGVVATMSVRTDRMLAAVQDGFLMATDLADYLVENGVPFREAHHAIGALVQECLRSGRQVRDFSQAELKAVHPKFDEGARIRLDPRDSLKRRDVVGGPAPVRVAEELTRWERALGLHGAARKGRR
jgi:argininosuccinate lyase